jgi:hypothetical protein
LRRVGRMPCCCSNKVRFEAQGAKVFGRVEFARERAVFSAGGVPLAHQLSHRPRGRHLYPAC